MLSFNVKCAIQVLAELERAKMVGRWVTISELKVSCELEGQSVPKVIKRLRRRHWVESSGSCHYLIIDLTLTTLYDLVLAIDDGILMGHDVAVESWPIRNRNKFLAAIELDHRLRVDMENKLKGVPLSGLFTCYESTGINTKKRSTAARVMSCSLVSDKKC